MDLGKVLAMILGLLGVLAYFFGFLPFLSYSNGAGDDRVSVSVYGAGPSYLPILLLIVGLLACALFLPGGRKYSLPVAVLAIAGLLSAIAVMVSKNLFDRLADSTGGTAASKIGIGMILLLVVALVQAAAAVYGWLADSGTLKANFGNSSVGGGTGNARAVSQSVPNFPPGPGGSGGSGPAQGGFGGYPPGGYTPGSVPGGPTPGSDSSYGSYGAGSYGQPGARSNDSYGQYPAPGDQGVPPQYGTGASPGAAEGNPSQQSSHGPSAAGEPDSSRSTTGQPGRDEGPAPDATQQVRF